MHCKILTVSPTWVYMILHFFILVFNLRAHLSIGQALRDKVPQFLYLRFKVQQLSVAHTAHIGIVRLPPVMGP